MKIKRDWNTKYKKYRRSWEPFRGFTTVVLWITGVLFCVGIVVFVFTLSPRLCQACKELVDKQADHEGNCKNCNEVIHMCITPNEHQNTCRGCGEIFHACDKPNTPKEEEPRYQHRIVGKREDGTPIYACKPKDSVTFPIPNR